MTYYKKQQSKLTLTFSVSLKKAPKFSSVSCDKKDHEYDDNDDDEINYIFYVELKTVYLQFGC